MTDKKAKQEMMNYLSEEIDKTNFGEVKVELSENKNCVDVVTTYRKRFFKQRPPDEALKLGDRISHNG
jgi:hypothetical protein